MNVKSVFTGLGYFFLGFILTLISKFILYDSGLEATLATVTGITTISDIIGFFVVLLWISLCTVMPLYYIYTGITQINEGEQITDIMVSIFMFLTSLILTYKGYYIFTTLGSLIGNDSFITILFWLSLGLTWVSITFIAPIYTIYVSLNG